VAKKLLPTILRSNATFAQKSEAFFHLTNNLAYPLLLLLSLLLLPNLALRTKHGIREVLLIDLPLFFGTTLSIASFYLASQREIRRLTNPGARAGIPWAVLRRLPLVMSVGIGLCVNQTRAVVEALLGRETEFVRTPKHGIRGRLESWSGKKYRAARSLTPFIEMAMAGYFVVAMVFALRNGHYVSMPFLALFLCGFAYVGWGSLWQGYGGARLESGWRRLMGTRRARNVRGIPGVAPGVATQVVTPPAFSVAVPAVYPSPKAAPLASRSVSSGAEALGGFRTVGPAEPALRTLTTSE
jgi:hypothetical protein